MPCKSDLRSNAKYKPLAALAVVCSNSPLLLLSSDLELNRYNNDYSVESKQIWKYGYAVLESVQADKLAVFLPFPALRSFFIHLLRVPQLESLNCPEMHILKKYNFRKFMSLLCYLNDGQLLEPRLKLPQHQLVKMNSSKVPEKVAL